MAGFLAEMSRVRAHSLLIDGTGTKDDLIAPDNGPNPVSGDTSVFNGTGILALGYNDGNGGSIDVHAQSLSVIGGAQIAAGAFGTGDGGKVTVAARSLLIDGTGAVGNVLFGTGIFTDAEPAVVSDASGNLSVRGSDGKAGEIMVQATKQSNSYLWRRAFLQAHLPMVMAEVSV